MRNLFLAAVTLGSLATAPLALADSMSCTGVVNGRGAQLTYPFPPGKIDVAKPPTVWRWVDTGEVFSTNQICFNYDGREQHCQVAIGPGARAGSSRYLAFGKRIDGDDFWFMVFDHTDRQSWADAIIEYPKLACGLAKSP